MAPWVFFRSMSPLPNIPLVSRLLSGQTGSSCFQNQEAGFERVGAVLRWAGSPSSSSTSPNPSLMASRSAGPMHSASGMEFLFDLTYQDQGRSVSDQVIFDRILSMIDAAEEFVVIDMFFFDGEHDGERDYRPLSAELTDRLLARKAANPGLKATFITDEINNFYGAYTGAEIARLRAAGIQVVITNLSRLRDSNPAYSAGWRLLAGWFGTGGTGLAASSLQQHRTQSHGHAPTSSS